MEQELFETLLSSAEEMVEIENELTFEDGSSLEENIIIVKKELLRLVEEKLAQYPNSDILQECVEWRKKEIKEIEDE